MLTAEQQGIAIVSLINMIPDDGCCADCCAPCHLLRELVLSDDLTYVVKRAPRHLWGPGWSWWDTGNEAVNIGQLYSRWACQSHPPCDAEDR